MLHINSVTEGIVVHRFVFQSFLYVRTIFLKGSGDQGP